MKRTLEKVFAVVLAGVMGIELMGVNCVEAAGGFTGDQWDFDKVETVESTSGHISKVRTTAAPAKATQIKQLSGEEVKETGYLKIGTFKQPFTKVRYWSNTYYYTKGSKNYRTDTDYTDKVIKETPVVWRIEGDIDVWMFERNEKMQTYKMMPGANQKKTAQKTLAKPATSSRTDKKEEKKVLLSDETKMDGAATVRKKVWHVYTNTYRYTKGSKTYTIETTYHNDTETLQTTPTSPLRACKRIYDECLTAINTSRRSFDASVKARIATQVPEKYQADALAVYNASKNGKALSRTTKLKDREADSLEGKLYDCCYGYGLECTIKNGKLTMSSAQAKKNKAWLDKGYSNYIRCCKQVKRNQKAAEAAQAFVQKQVKGMPSGLSEYQKAAYLLDKFKYCGLRINNAYADNIGIGDVVLSNSGACGGTAHLYNAMCEEVGLVTHYLVGYTSSGHHAFSRVRCDGKWYYADAGWYVTSGSQYGLSRSLWNNHRFFGSYSEERDFVL